MCAHILHLLHHCENKTQRSSSLHWRNAILAYTWCWFDFLQSWYMLVPRSDVPCMLWASWHNLSCFFGTVWLKIWAATLLQMCTYICLCMLMWIIAVFSWRLFLLNLVAESPPLAGLATNAVGRSERPIYGNGGTAALWPRDCVPWKRILDHF